MFVVVVINPQEVEKTIPSIAGIITEGIPEKVKELFEDIARRAHCEITETGGVICSPVCHLYLVEVFSLNQVQLRQIMAGTKKVQELMTNATKK